MVFDHCKTPEEAWHTFYAVACLCHPSQGGAEDDFGALCGMAQQALGPAWPPEYDRGTPALFDIFCRATGTQQPPGTPSPGTAPLASWVPGPYVGTAFAGVPVVGRMWLLRATE